MGCLGRLYVIQQMLQLGNEVLPSFQETIRSATAEQTFGTKSVQQGNHREVTLSSWVRACYGGFLPSHITPEWEESRLGVQRPSSRLRLT